MIYSNPKGELISNNMLGKTKFMKPISFRLTRKHEESINKEKTDFRKDTKIKVHNETNEPIVLGKGSLIAYAAKADEAIITENEEECGRKYCNQAGSHTPKDLLKPDQRLSIT